MKLQELRGGFSEGCRNFAAFLLASILAGLGVPPEQVIERVQELGARCKPPLSGRECSDAVKSVVRRRYRFSNATIAQRLEITPEEAEQLETWLPAGVTKAVQGTEEVSRCNETQKARRNAIIEIIEQGGGVLPSTREMSKLLKDKGHKASNYTVHRDYRALGLVEVSSSPSPSKAPVLAA